MALLGQVITDYHLVGAGSTTQCFPFYIYDEDGTNRRENITDWALEAFRSHYGPRRLPDESQTLIRPSGTFSQGEKDRALHLSPGERSAAKRTGEGPGVSPAVGTGKTPLIRPSGTFSQGEKGRDLHLSPGERSAAERAGEGPGRSSGDQGEKPRRTSYASLDPGLLAFARDLCQGQTDAEQYLWSILRDRRLAGAKFRRQVPFEPYVVDFYCHEAKLAVELDGGQHNSEEGRRKDESRTRSLADRGVHVLRFWNHEVFEDTEPVLEAIVQALEASRAQPAPSPEGPSPRPISKWDIFYYVYGVLHQPEYRATFADNLKRELPRIPFMPDFEAFAGAGRALAGWHLEYETVEPWPLTWVETPGVPLSYQVTKMKLSKDKTSLKVNDSLSLADIPPEAARYRLGNRSALEWVVDQYQVSEDGRSGIRSDPNREDDPEYIVRLVGQVVRVSVETVKVVESLPGGLGVGLAGAGEGG